MLPHTSSLLDVSTACQGNEVTGPSGRNNFHSLGCQRKKEEDALPLADTVLCACIMYTRLFFSFETN